MKIYYGIENNNVNVTDICLNKLLKDNIITIPLGDHNRAKYFGDPVYGIKKKIFISINDNNNEQLINDNNEQLINDNNEQLINDNNEQLINDNNNEQLINDNNEQLINDNNNEQLINDNNEQLINDNNEQLINDNNNNEQLINDNNNNEQLITYDEKYRIYINIITNEIITDDETNINNMINNKINELHTKLNLNYGSFKEELPEQKMVIRYLTGNEKVLEIGGNIGRNSLIIGSILENSTNLVTLESDEYISNQLIENRNLNNLHFHVENSALSIKKMIQKGWNTTQSDILLDGYKWVNTITVEELKNKYNIIFDTLVLDCEGSFYYILLDMPEILDNINLIIMENDYFELPKKQYVDKILTENNFIRDYYEIGGWGPCYQNFFEVWKK
jgi:hypothetical protein